MASIWVLHGKKKTNERKIIVEQVNEILEHNPSLDDISMNYGMKVVTW